MKENIKGGLFVRLRRAAMVVVAGGIATVSAVYARPSNSIVVVPPTDLPELARQPGETMLLRETIDGRAILYVEQEQGARLAIFDVTDPGHIKGEGSVKLSAGGPFDFVSPVGTKQELIQYRQGHEAAVLDFRKLMLPDLKTLQDLTLGGPIARLGDDGFIVASGRTQVPPIRDYQVVDITGPQIHSTVFDVKEVRERITKTDTGTTFLLANDGLYVVRRPDVESEKRRRDEEWVSEHAG